MNADKDDLKTFFQNMEGIIKDNVKYYIRWFNRFLEYYDGNLDDVSEGDLKTFGDFLENKGYEDWQVKHAQEAVFLYIEKFLDKKIAFKDIQTEENVYKQQCSMKTWEEEKDIFISKMRLRHYSYNTEKSYQEWVRWFILYARIKSPSKAKPEDVKRFLSHLAIERKVASSNQNQAFRAAGTAEGHEKSGSQGGSRKSHKCSYPSAFVRDASVAGRL